VTIDERDARPSTSGVAAFLVGHAVLLMLFLGVLYFAVPRQKQMFSDLGMELPSNTLLAIEVSNLVIDFLYPVQVLFVLYLLLHGWLTFWIRRSGRVLYLLWCGATFGVPVAVAVLVGFAMFRPFIITPMELGP